MENRQIVGKCVRGRGLLDLVTALNWVKTSLWLSCYKMRNECDTFYDSLLRNFLYISSAVVTSSDLLWKCASRFLDYLPKIS
jgi:hypothetical protein